MLQIPRSVILFTKRKFLIFIVFAYVSIGFCHQISAQWTSSGKIVDTSPWYSLGDSIIPLNHWVNALKIAQDRSIWLVTIAHNCPPTTEATVLRSTDEGAHWTISVIDAPDSTYIMDIAPVDSLVAYVALSRTDISKNEIINGTAGLFKTINGGKDWSRLESFPFSPTYVHFFDKNNGWSFSYEKRMPSKSNDFIHSVTTDGGRTWTHIGGANWESPQGTSLPPRDSFEFPSYVFSTSPAYDCTDHAIIMGSSTGDYWFSKDRGFNWTRNETPLSEQNLKASCVAIKDLNTFVIAGNILNNLGDVFRGKDTRSYTTLDGGNTWLESKPGVTASATHYIAGSDSIFIMTGNQDYSWGGGKGSAISYDYGLSWESIDYGNYIIMDFLDKDYGFAACSNLKNWPARNGQVYKWQFKLLEAPLSKVNWWPWGVIAGLLTFGIGFHRIHLKQVKKKAGLSLEMAELESAALQAQMNPHFIFNALNSLQYYINQNEKENSNIFLGHFSRLIRGTLQASKTKTVSLRTEIDLLKSYLALEKIRFDHRFEYKIIIGDGIDMDSIFLPPMITQPLVENAVLHGMSGISKGGRVELEYQMDEGNILIITLKDNGRGLNYLKDPIKKGHKSTGLENTKKRLKLMNNENEMDISELHDESGMPTGTMVMQYIHLKL